jgi:endonuclease III
MKINVPNINDLLKKVMYIEFSFEGDQKSINDWLQEHREIIKNNQKLLVRRNEKNDIKILITMLSDLLIRATKGERGIRVYEELKKKIECKHDLTKKCYKEVLKNASYRWGIETGIQIISEVVNFFSNKLSWNWKQYFDDAERFKNTDFQQDDLLKIKNIGFKVRDLALSKFNCNYVANDLHVVRVITRTGLLNYGYDIVTNRNLEMGNNPGNNKNYLFLHSLVLKLSSFTNSKYSPADLDRIFWSFGKSICGNNPKCNICPVNTQCLTGQNRI